jgi:hypothetical protein
VRAVACVLVMLLLGACSNRDPYVTAAGETTSGNWKIARQLDKVTQTELPSASVRAMASNTYVANASGSLLQITCFDKQPIVRFAFEFKIGSDKNTILGYRFDDKPGHDSVASRVLTGETAILVDNPVAVAEFVNGMTGSQKLYLRIRSLTLGRTTAEYPLEGSATAVQAAFAGCPVMLAQTKKHTS